MNDIERLFWEKPNSPKRLTDYIKHLVNNSRYLEASFFQSKLDEIKPHDVKSIKQGFKIAVLNLDHDKVSYYHRKLFEVRTEKNDLILLDLFYYCVVGNTKEMDACLDHVLNRNISNDFAFEVVANSILKTKNISLISRFINNLSSSKKSPNELLSKRIKKILIPHIISILRKYHHEKLSNN